MPIRARVTFNDINRLVTQIETELKKVHSIPPVDMQAVYPFLFGQLKAVREILSEDEPADSDSMAVHREIASLIAAYVGKESKERRDLLVPQRLSGQQRAFIGFFGKAVKSTAPQPTAKKAEEKGGLVRVAGVAVPIYNPKHPYLQRLSRLVNEYAAAVSKEKPLGTQKGLFASITVMVARIEQEIRGLSVLVPKAHMRGLYDYLLKVSEPLELLITKREDVAHFTVHKKIMGLVDAYSKKEEKRSLR